MEHDSKLAELLRREWTELLDRKLAIEQRMNAIVLLLGFNPDDEEAERQRLDAVDGGESPPPKKKRGRRSNAQIAADKAAAEATERGGQAEGGDAEDQSVDEAGNEAAQ